MEFRAAAEDIARTSHAHPGLAEAVKEAALGVAGRATLLEGDWRRPDWTRPLGGPFDLLVSNPPYIEAATIDGLMPEVARYEPRLALDGGPDGLAAYRAIGAASCGLVAPSGLVLVEVGEGQAAEIAGIFAAAGLQPGAPFKDLGGIDRVVRATH